MMYFSFFSKTDKTPKKRFFNPKGISSADDTSASTDRDSTSAGTFRPIDLIDTLSFRRLRLIRPKESRDDLLEKLLRNAENSSGQACHHYLEQMLNFLKKNPDLINRVPNRFHSNPLELVIRLGHFKMAEELIAMKASVRPENRSLLKKIEHLLQANRGVHKWQIPEM